MNLVLAQGNPLTPGQCGDTARTSIEQLQRRDAWIREQRLSQSEAVYIPIDYDPAHPYPREDGARA